VSPFYWPSLSKCQSIKGAKSSQSHQLNATSQKSQKQIFVFSLSKKRIKHRKIDEHIEVHQELHHPRTLTTFPATQSATKSRKFDQFAQESTSQNQYYIEFRFNFAKSNKNQRELARRRFSDIHHHRTFVPFLQSKPQR
jgi:hypothetical protein